jgi:hypothetical protein
MLSSQNYSHNSYAKIIPFFIAILDTYGHFTHLYPILSFLSHMSTPVLVLIQ